MKELTRSTATEQQFRFLHHYTFRFSTTELSDFSTIKQSLFAKISIFNMLKQKIHGIAWFVASIDKY